MQRKAQDSLQMEERAKKRHREREREPERKGERDKQIETYPTLLHPTLPYQHNYTYISLCCGSSRDNSRCSVCQVRGVPHGRCYRHGCAAVTQESVGAGSYRTRPVRHNMCDGRRQLHGGSTWGSRWRPRSANVSQASRCFLAVCRAKALAARRYIGGARRKRAIRPSPFCRICTLQRRQRR